MHNRCSFNDKQMIKLQETPDRVPDGQTPQTVLAYAEDPVAPAKVIEEYAKKNDKLVIIGGAMGATVLDAEGVMALAKMPSREEVLASIVGSLLAPASNLINAITAPATNIAGVLKTITEKEDA